MRRTVFGTLLAFFLAACTPPLGDGAYMELPDARADKVTAGVGEPVEVTVIGGFGATDNYHLEEFVEPGVSLGACFLYAADMETGGGLCLGGERPLPKGLSMVDGTTVAKEFGDITVERGELLEIEHTFTFTSEKPGKVVIVPFYQFSYGPNEDSSTENGPDGIVRVTFE